MRASDYTDQFDLLVRELGAAEFRRSHPEAVPLPSVVVVIPAYQEADNIGVVLEAMPRSVCGRQLATVVIDDGSQDATVELARKAGALAVRSPVNRGGGAALRMGFDIARAHGAEIVVTMDADGQHLPTEIERLVAPITDGSMDFVIGSRILGRREKDSLIRYLGIHVFNAVIRLLTAVKITDCSNGFRAFRVSELSRVQLRQDQFHASELIIDAAKKGIRIGEAPVTVKRRLSGESKKGRNWRYGLGFARTILKTWWR
jgi:glycosyltransferase involved in cell wall biosynthesis